MSPTYLPDFSTECRICGTTPCVVVVGHMQADTELCGVCFFHDFEMLDWSLWDDAEPPSDDN